MKKIKDKGIHKRKQKRNKLIIGIFLVIVMLFSTAGYAFYRQRGGDESESNEFNYNGVKFVRGSNGFWRFNINNEEFMTYNSPKEVNVVGSIDMSIEDYRNKPLYFSVNSSDNEVSEIGQNLRGKVLRMQKACLSDCSQDLPVKNCSQDNIIIIKKSNYSNMWQKEKCVYINSKDLRGTDSFIYKILDIK